MKKITLFLFAFYFLIACDLYPAEETLQYITIKKGKIKNKAWTITDKNNSFIVKSSSDSKSSCQLELDQNYHLIRFEELDPSEDYELIAYRQNNQLIAKVKIGKESFSQTYTIDDQRWVQEFAFGFKEFLSSEKKNMRFQILHPKDLSMYELIIIKEEEENLSIDDKTYQAQKVKITLPGFRGRFWKAQAWYDVTSFELLRYKANEGPGTAVSETLFMGKK